MFDRERVQKEGDYKEELIQSICAKSGIFVKEFREIVDDPYARNEFIMSISMKPAQFGKVMAEKHKLEETVKIKHNRKQKLIYELEVNDKMRQIQKKQQKQREQKEKQNLNVGQNLFAKIMGQ